MVVKTIKGMEEVFAPYDAFIFDLWGVLHDGLKALPQSIEILKLLKKAERKIWLLSNAPRRASNVVKCLTEMGISKNLYNGILTSGEMTWLALKDELINKWGKSCFHLGPYEHSNIYVGLDINITTDISKADFILNSGVFNNSDDVDEYRDFFKEPLSNKTPMLCANPDKIVHIGKKLVICSGALAGLYEEMGGKVVYFGKPYREAYSICKKSLDTDNILAIGDSMITDIKGANSAGIDSLLVLSGIHRNEVSLENINNFIEKYPYNPNYIIEKLKW